MKAAWPTTASRPNAPSASATLPSAQLARPRVAGISTMPSAWPASSCWRALSMSAGCPTTRAPRSASSLRSNSRLVALWSSSTTSTGRLPATWWRYAAG
ncbi:hypothetical protein G6F52_013647 [Rhizopus delemar]|nr:hypothetical protein G6F52_013647 [Rhizopus delemar]